MSARRPRGFLGLIIAVLVVVVIGGAAWVAASGVLAPERLKTELQRAALRATGRALTINGPVTISLGLAPRVVVNDVALANLSGGTRPQMITAAKVTAQVALLPLLSGDLVFESIVVQAPDILLERAPDGTANWLFTAPKHALYQPQTDQPAAASSSAEGGDTEIESIHLNGGQVAWRGPIGAPMMFGIASADLSADSSTSPMRVALRGNVGGLDFTMKLLAGSFDRLRGGPTTALAGAWPLTLDMAGGGATLHMEGGFTHPDQFRNYDFRLTANAPDLSLLQPAVPGYRLPPLHDVNFTTRLFDGTEGDLRTAGLSLHAGESNLSAMVPGLGIKDATLSAPGPGQTAQFNVNGVFQGTVLHVTANATQPDFMALSAPTTASLSAEVANASFTAKGTIPAGLGLNGLDLLVSARVPDLAQLAPLIPYKLPDVRDVSFDAKVGDAGYKLRGVTLRDIVFASSLGDLAGTLTVAWSPVIDLAGTLQSKTLDLDKLGFSAFVNAPAPMPPASTVPPASGTAPPAAIADTPLPIAKLRGADADLSLTFNNVVLGGETLRDFQTRLQAADGKLVLNPFRVTAPEGVIIGGATIDASTDQPPVAVNLRSPALSSAVLAAALGYPGAASGPVQVDVALNGVGASTRALMATATGHVGLSMVNGQVSDAALAGVFGAALGAAGVPAGGDGTSQVGCFALRADLTDGHGTLQTLALDTSRLSMDGDGSFDLAARTLNLHLRPRLSLGGASAAAPVSVKGSFDAPRVALDPVLDGGRVGITIGGVSIGHQGSACADDLRIARGGMAGPLPAAVQSQDTTPSGKKKKPIDLLRSLLHHS
jgi:AsmA protein